MSTTSILPPALPPEPTVRISVAQYHSMIGRDFFADDEQIELLEGWLFPKMAKNPPHRRATRAVRKSLEAIVPAKWEVETQEPITTSDSEPEPDVGVIREGALDRTDRHPLAKEVGMVVEVADATLARDRGMKKRIYARARIPIYWIVNLVDRQVEVHSDPTGAGKKPTYRQTQIFIPGDAIPILLDGKNIGEIAVDQILP